MEILLQGFAHNKYRLTIFGLLAGASVVCVGILRFRASLTGSSDYAFLIWNLFLAWIPFIIAYIMYITSFSRRWLFFIMPISVFIWLIFFPNAPYILTDFQHLSNPGANIPVWYDVILLIWFSFTGLFLGYPKRLWGIGPVFDNLYPAPYAAITHFCRLVHPIFSIRLFAYVHLRPYEP